MGKYDHIDAPYQFKEFWSKYPHGYTIYEALLDWVSQVNDLLDSNATLEQNILTIRGELDSFLATVPDQLQTIANDLLEGWLTDGTFADLINEVLFAGLQTQIEQITINVLEYGAVGDGVTNDTPAIQSAIDQLNSLGGGKLVFPATADYYLLQNVLSLKSNIIYEGYQTKIKSMAGAFYTITGGLKNIVIRGFDHELLNGTANGFVTMTGTALAPITQVIIENNTGDNGELGLNVINLSYVDQAIIRHNVCKNSGSGKGISLVDACTHVIIEHNKVYDSGRNGIGIFANCRHITIRNNYIEGWMLRRGDLGTEEGGLDSYGAGNENIHIINNVIDTGTKVSAGAFQQNLIRIQGAEKVYIEKNHLVGRSASMGQMVRIANRDEFPSQDVWFIDNTIETITAPSYVFRLQSEGCKNIQFKRNKIKLGAKPTVNVFEIRADAEDVTIEGNHFDCALETSALINSSSSTLNVKNLVIKDNIATIGGMLFGPDATTYDKLLISGNIVKSSWNNTSNGLINITATMKIISIVNNVLEKLVTPTINSRGNARNVGYVEIIAGNTEIINGVVALVDQTKNVSTVATSTTTETDLFTYSILNRFFGVMGSGVKIKVSGTKTGAGGNKTIKLYVGGTAIDVHPGANNTNNWMLDVEVFSRGLTSQFIVWRLVDGTATTQGYATRSFNNANAPLEIKVTGACATGTDAITKQMAIVDFIH